MLPNLACNSISSGCQSSAVITLANSTSVIDMNTLRGVVGLILGNANAFGLRVALTNMVILL